MKISSAFKNDAGIPFCAVLLEPGEYYGNIVHGLDRQRVREGERLVEFYDARFPHTDLGQFVTRYNADSIAGHVGGLVLDGGVKDWRVSAANMELVKRELGLARL